MVNNIWPLCVYWMPSSRIQFDLKHMLIMVFSDRSISLAFVNIVTLLIFEAVIFHHLQPHMPLRSVVVHPLLPCNVTAQPLHPPFLFSSLLSLH
jgi:hypothetical protein